jgi:vesicle transport through interaction with t-SNAREs protein 1
MLRRRRAQVREYKADVAKLRERAREAAAADSGGAAARAELGLGDDWAASNAGQRDRMLRSTERLEQTGDRIKQGRQQLLETEARSHTSAQRAQTGRAGLGGWLPCLCGRGWRCGARRAPPSALKNRPASA